MALHFWGALFIQWQLRPTPGNREDNPMPNNVAEELSSKLPSQIGSVASTQLRLKYGNCISHYRPVEIVLGELLKVRRGVCFRSDMLCGLPAYTAEISTMTMGQQKEARGKGRVINKHSWIDILEKWGILERLVFWPRTTLSRSDLSSASYLKQQPHVKC